MHNDTNSPPELKKKITNNALEKNQLRDVTVLAAELKRLMVHRSEVLREEGVKEEIQQLEDWLDIERKGPAPAGIISEGGIHWLKALRDRLKLSAEETQRLESEGGNPVSQEQSEKLESLLKTIRRMDKIIDEISVEKSH